MLVYVCVCLLVCVGAELHEWGLFSFSWSEAQESQESQESHCNYHIFTGVHVHACGQLNTLWLSELSMKPVVCVTSICLLFFVCISPSSACFTSRESETKMKRGNVQQGKQQPHLSSRPAQGNDLLMCPSTGYSSWGSIDSYLPVPGWRGFRFCSETDLCPLVNIKSMLLQAALQKHLIQREAEKQALKSLYVPVCDRCLKLHIKYMWTMHNIHFFYMQGTPGWPTHA